MQWNTQTEHIACVHGELFLTWTTSNEMSVLGPSFSFFWLQIVDNYIQNPNLPYKGTFMPFTLLLGGRDELLKFFETMTLGRTYHRR